MERIDWNLPLETDEPTPRHVRAGGPTPYPGYYCAIGDTAYEYRLDGTPSGFYAATAPKIRNVRALRTSDECLQRMEAFVRRMADGWEAMSLTGPEVSEAREIVTLLPVPRVDPDLIEARKLCDQSDYDLGDAPVITNGKICNLVVAGIKRGRELAHAEYAADLETPGTFYRSIDLPARP